MHKYKYNYIYIYILSMSTDKFYAQNLANDKTSDIF